MLTWAQIEKQVEMMSSDLDKITFFGRFEKDILAGVKTITLRDESESGYEVDRVYPVHTLEENRWFCDIKVLAVAPILFDELDKTHAEQENMSLEQLKAVIQDIYPGIKQLYMISYQLVDGAV